jgi:hypothetical protein
MLTRRQLILTAAGLAGVAGLRPPKAEGAAWRRGAEAPTRRSEVAAALLGDRIYLIVQDGQCQGEFA